MTNPFLPSEGLDIHSWISQQTHKLFHGELVWVLYLGAIQSAKSATRCIAFKQEPVLWALSSISTNHYYSWYQPWCTRAKLKNFRWDVLSKIFRLDFWQYALSFLNDYHHQFFPDIRGFRASTHSPPPWAISSATWFVSSNNGYDLVTTGVHRSATKQLDYDPIFSTQCLVWEGIWLSLWYCEIFSVYSEYSTYLQI